MDSGGPEDLAEEPGFNAVVMGNHESFDQKSDQSRCDQSDKNIIASE